MTGSKKKTSKAEYFHARLNPIHEDEARIIDTIKAYESQGINFKQLIVKLIDGKHIEIATPQSNITLEQIEELLSRFAQKMSIRDSDSSIFNDRDDDIPSTEFVHNFARGFMARTDTQPDGEIRYEDIQE